MLKLSVSMLALLAPAAALATPAEELHFERDGASYAYTVSQQDGAQVIDGVEKRTNQRFHYVVRGRHVSGGNGLSTVEFDMPDAGPDGKLAAR